LTIKWRIIERKTGRNEISSCRGVDWTMYIGKRYLNREPIEGGALCERPMQSEKIGEIFRRVKRRVEA
jgi:hypothetical protein